MVVILSLCDALGQLQYFQSECLNSDNLIRVDINLLLIAILICEGLFHVKILDSVAIIFGHNWMIYEVLLGLCCSFSLGLHLSLTLRFDLKCLGANSEKNCETKDKLFHFGGLCKR